MTQQSANQDIQYYVELLTHIKLVDLVLVYKDTLDYDGLDFTLEFEQTNKHTVVNVVIKVSEEVTRQIKIDLPGCIETDQVASARAKDHLNIKLRWKDQALNHSKTIYSWLSPPMPAAAFKETSRILCDACRACIADAGETKRFRRVIDLPSEYWREMVDCWVCHREEYEVVKAAEANLTAKSDTLLVGASHLFIHPNRIDMKKIRVGNEVSQKADWLDGKKVHIALDINVPVRVDRRLIDTYDRYKHPIVMLHDQLT
jgi:hypothetical protein